MGMPRQAFFPAEEAESVALAATPEAVPLARRLVIDVARQWRLPHGFADDAELVMSELTINAIKATHLFYATHGRAETGNIRIRLRWTTPSLFTEIWDVNPMLPTPRKASEDDAGGRGLGIVEFICARWAAERCEDGGKLVWAELRLPRT
ncbi:ATP-binding protein [Actinoallomurus sp. NBC_01490]|uniref:ATP-binding protein n=1 Tax=Actinoallomurus sp. NBC_01490 TaxID=2903557 RepID=UPI002E373828|nr:ATP-binding protein [Actinoallomurus sp. NBC_01490]